MKAGCLGLAAIFIFIAPAVANAGFIAIPISDQLDATEEIAPLENNFDTIFENYGESDVSTSSFSSLTQVSADPLLADEYFVDGPDNIGTVRIQEPGTLALLGIGLIGMAMFRRSARTQQ